MRRKTFRPYDDRRARPGRRLDRGRRAVVMGSQLHRQRGALTTRTQKVVFPAAGSAAISDAAIKPYLTKYAGQQLVNGAQAQAYADHFINVHLQKIGGGQTYAQLSAASNADPTNTKLAAQVQTMFRGETLRGLLLNGYAFWKMGQIAAYAAVAAFVGAGLLLLLAGLGLLHLRRTDPAADVLPHLGGPSPAPARR